MSATETHLTPTPELEAALREFNEAFNYGLRLPIVAETVRAASAIAQMRGQTDLAVRLMACAPLEPRVKTVVEKHPYAFLKQVLHRD
jgi:hypothetical protein